MNRSVSRRLERLETQAAVATAMTFEPHTIVFVDPDKRVTGAIRWDRDKKALTHPEDGLEDVSFEALI